MVGSEIYNPEQWNNFFVLVGTGSAALTGLVFVAMSINLKAVAKDATHRYRAINMLSGFTAVFIVSALALMGHQTNRTLGIEWLIVSLFAAAINTNGYIQGFSSAGSRGKLPRTWDSGGPGGALRRRAECHPGVHSGSSFTRRRLNSLLAKLIS